MSFRILPQDFNMLGDNYVIRTNVPIEELTNEMVAERAKNANLSAGDHILVQCMDHYKKEVLGETEFVITKRLDEFVQIPVGDREIRQGTQVTIEVEMKTPWWVPGVKNRKVA